MLLYSLLWSDMEFTLGMATRGGGGAAGAMGCAAGAMGYAAGAMGCAAVAMGCAAGALLVSVSSNECTMGSARNETDFFIDLEWLTDLDADLDADLDTVVLSCFLSDRLSPDRRDSDRRSVDRFLSRLPCERPDLAV